MNETAAKKVEDFFNSGRKVIYKKGALILSPGEAISKIYLIKEGYVRQYSISEDGEEITLNIFRPGAYFPTMLLLADSPNNYFWQAENKVETWQQSPQLLLNFIKANPDVLLDLATRFSQAILGLSKRIETLSTGSIYAKVVALLSYLASRFGEENSGKVVISLPLTHNEIATWVGAKRETVSRAMERLAKEGIIEHENHTVIVKDKKKLADKLSLFYEES